MTDTDSEFRKRKNIDPQEVELMEKRARLQDETIERLQAEVTRLTQHVVANKAGQPRNVPEFSGKAMDFNSWKLRFTNLVINQELPSTTKFEYLLNCTEKIPALGHFSVWDGSEDDLNTALGHMTKLYGDKSIAGKELIESLQSVVMRRNRECEGIILKNDCCCGHGNESWQFGNL